MSDAKPKPAQTAPVAFTDWYAGKDADAYAAGRRAGIEQAAAACASEPEPGDGDDVAEPDLLDLTRTAPAEALLVAVRATKRRIGQRIRALLPATDGAEEKTDGT